VTQVGGILSCSEAASPMKCQGSTTNASNLFQDHCFRVRLRNLFFGCIFKICSVTRIILECDSVRSRHKLNGCVWLRLCM
jgi:hypothetical protein